MNKHVVFHIGVHKCATTSLQSALYHFAVSKPELQLHATTKKSPLENYLCRLTWGMENAHTMDDLAEIFLTHLKKNDQTDRFVFSNENFLGPMMGLTWRPMMGMTRDFYPDMTVLREFIDRISKEYPTTVLMQSRETSSWLASIYKFRVRRGLSKSYDQFIQYVNMDTISWERLGDTVLDGTDFAVIDVDDLRNNSDNVRRFTEKIHPDWGPSGQTIPMVNEELSPHQRALALVLNKIGIAPENIDGLLSNFQSLDADDPDLKWKVAMELDRAGLRIPLEVAELAVTEIRNGLETRNHLDKIIKNHFAKDYEMFRDKYVNCAAIARLKHSSI